jgi:hypothetical protein
MIMCHMVADSDDELHAMAARIGVSRRWHQGPPRHDSHYDIALSKRRLAVKNGAVEVSWRTLGLMVIRRRRTGALGAPEDVTAWARVAGSRVDPDVSVPTGEVSRSGSDGAVAS